MIKNITKNDCLKILANNCIGHMAYVYKNMPFVVPITYYYDKPNNILIGYTSEGHKTEALKANKYVALEVADIESINNWKTVLVHGTYEALDGSEAKFELHQFSEGVKQILSEKGEKEYHFISEFSGKTDSENIPIVYRINIEDITGKTRAL